MYSKLVLVFLLVLALSYPALAPAVMIDRIAAIVNEDVITQSEVYSSEKLNLQFSGLPQNESALQQRIDFRLILQQLQNQPPVAVTKEEMDRAIQPYIESLGGQEKFSAFLGSIGMSQPDFEEEVRMELSVRKFVADRFRPFVNITLDDAQKYYDEVYVPVFEILRQQPPTFPESFEEIQIQMVEAQVQDRVKEWLAEIRKSANITIKD